MTTIWVFHLIQSCLDILTAFLRKGQADTRDSIIISLKSNQYTVVHTKEDILMLTIRSYL